MGTTAFPAIDTTEPLGSSRQQQAGEVLGAPDVGQYDFANGGLKPTPQQQHPSPQFVARSAALAVPETVQEEASARSASGKAPQRSHRRSKKGKRRRRRRHKSASSSDWSSASSSSSSSSSSGGSESDSSVGDDRRPLSATERSALVQRTRASMHLVPSHTQHGSQALVNSSGFHTAAMQSH